MEIVNYLTLSMVICKVILSKNILIVHTNTLMLISKRFGLIISMLFSSNIMLEFPCLPIAPRYYLYSYETEFVQNLIHEKMKILAVAYNSTF